MKVQNIKDIDAFFKTVDDCSGRVEGLKEASEKIARNLKQLAVPIEVITKSTGLTSEEIEAL